jgi:NhaD family Na+/H+ antiporter
MDMAVSEETLSGHLLDLSLHWVGIVSLLVFLVAYILVIFEEKTHLKKSKPTLIAAGIIWSLIAWVYGQQGLPEAVAEGIKHSFLEYAELFFFLLVAMTYINAMLERGLFDELRNRLLARGLSYRMLFWSTGFLAFFISPIADNLTTALILCAVVLAVGRGNSQYVAISCVNIVVAANAGGAFSPFGDITTLMVWQQGLIEFAEFFELFIPALINFLIPAICMHFAIETGSPAQKGLDTLPNQIKAGGLIIALLFLCTIVTAVSFHNFLHIPPVFGMMLGLGYLKLFGFYLQQKSISKRSVRSVEMPPGHHERDEFNVFDRIAQAEWDTLFFFYGVIMSVGGLSFIGYLNLASSTIYGELGPTVANILVGVISAIVDNIPVMFAVLSMQPEMPEYQWLLVTLTAGVGGSLLSVGSAAGVALMGQARGHYTFFSHLKWTPAIALGYAASIFVHFLLNT